MLILDFRDFESKGKQNPGTVGKTIKSSRPDKSQTFGQLETVVPLAIRVPWNSFGFLGTNVLTLLVLTSDLDRKIIFDEIFY